MMFHVTASANVRRCAAAARPGQRHPANDPDFGSDELEAIVADWCERAPASPSAAAPTSATTPATASCRSASATLIEIIS
jgi:hypothetical protein